MKTIAALAILGFLAALPLQADQEGTKTAATNAANPYETAGTLISYNATTKALVVATPESTAPISYTTNSQTELVDEANNPLTVNSLRENIPVTVFYAKGPSEMVATKVIVRRTISAPR